VGGEVGGSEKETAEVEFKGLFRVRLLLGEDGRRRVIVAELAEVLGLQSRGLKQRVQRSVPKGWCMMHPPSAGGAQEVLALDLKYLPALLAGIEVGRVRPEVRPRLEEIQEELYEALAAYVFEGGAVNRAFPGALPPPAAVPPDPVAVVTAALASAVTAQDLDGARRYHAALAPLLRAPRPGPPAPRVRLAPQPPPPPDPDQVPRELVDRAREVLRARGAKGIAGGIDGWAKLVGGKSTRARAACHVVEELGEVESRWEDGRLVRRWRPAPTTGAAT
jgi:hypothetical protein